jgi:hypothetical protein
MFSEERSMARTCVVVSPIDLGRIAPAEGLRPERARDAEALVKAPIASL